jgi:hypothetical protein
MDTLDLPFLEMIPYYFESVEDFENKIKEMNACDRPFSHSFAEQRLFVE